MSADKSALLPCPFCGGEVQGRSIEEDGEWIGEQVSCEACDYALMYSDAEQAVQKFNTRTQPKETPSEGALTEAAQKVLKWYSASDPIVDVLKASECYGVMADLASALNRSVGAKERQTKLEAVVEAAQKAMDARTVDETREQATLNNALVCRIAELEEMNVMTEFCWLVERWEKEGNSHGLYYSGKQAASGPQSFTMDVHEAKRYATREEANAQAVKLNEARDRHQLEYQVWKASEHGFIGATLTATPAAPAQDGLRERVDAETAERIKAQCHSGDEERDHGKADDILVDAIGPLTKAAFDEVDKWYA